VDRHYPYASSLLLVAMGLAPMVLVTHYYGVLPNRMVIQWDLFGRMTVIGTKASTVMTVANFAAIAGLCAFGLLLWLHKSMRSMRLLRPFLALNLSQILAINLTCAMLVSDALGLQLRIKPMIPAAMSVILFSAAVLCWRLDGSANGMFSRLAGAVLAVAGIFVLAFSATVSNTVVGFYSAALAALAMIALVLPERHA